MPFLKQCITVEEENCEFENAEEMLIKVDRLIEVLKGNYAAQLVFSSLSASSTTNVTVRDNPEDMSSYPKLTKIQFFLPRPSDVFRGLSGFYRAGRYPSVSH